MIDHTPFNQAIDCIVRLRDAYEAADKGDIQAGEMTVTNGWVKASINWPGNAYSHDKRKDLKLRFNIEARVEAADADS